MRNTEAQLPLATDFIIFTQKLWYALRCEQSQGWIYKKEGGEEGRTRGMWVLISMACALDHVRTGCRALT